MDFGTSVKTCLKKYVVFSGRAPRSEYWWFALFSALVGVVASVIDATVLGISPLRAGSGIGTAQLVGLALFLPSIAVMVRRFHDTGKSGWWFFICLLFAVVLFFVFSLILGIVAASFILSMQASLTNPATASATFTQMFCLGLVTIFICYLPYLYFMAKPSQKGSNQYGDPE